MVVDKYSTLEEEIRLEFEKSQEMKDYAERVEAMDRDALEAELVRLDDALEDAEDEMRLMIGQTGVHMYAGQVDGTREGFAREKAKIDVKKRLVSKALST